MCLSTAHPLSISSVLHLFWFSFSSFPFTLYFFMSPTRSPLLCCACPLGVTTISATLRILQHKKNTAHGRLRQCVGPSLNDRRRCAQHSLSVPVVEKRLPAAHETDTRGWLLVEPCSLGVSLLSCRSLSRKVMSRHKMKGDLGGHSLAGRTNDVHLQCMGECPGRDLNGPSFSS